MVTRSASAALKTINSQFNVEQFETTIEEINDELSIHNEINQIMANISSIELDESLEKELKELQSLPESNVLFETLTQTERKETYTGEKVSTIDKKKSKKSCINDLNCY